MRKLLILLLPLFLAAPVDYATRQFILQTLGDTSSAIHSVFSTADDSIGTLLGTASDEVRDEIRDSVLVSTSDSTSKIDTTYAPFQTYVGNHATGLSAWNDSAVVALRHDGSVALTANWAAGDFDITGLEKVEADTHTITTYAGFPTSGYITGQTIFQGRDTLICQSWDSVFEEFIANYYYKMYVPQDGITSPIIIASPTLRFVVGNPPKIDSGGVTFGSRGFYPKLDTITQGAQRSWLGDINYRWGTIWTRHLISTDPSKADSLRIHMEADSAKFDSDNPFAFNATITAPSFHGTFTGVSGEISDTAQAYAGASSAEIGDSMALTLRHNGSQALTADWAAGDFDITGLNKIEADTIGDAGATVILDTLVLPLWNNKPATASIGAIGLDTTGTDTLWINTQDGWGVITFGIP